MAALAPIPSASFSIAARPPDNVEISWDRPRLPSIFAPGKREIQATPTPMALRESGAHESPRLKGDSLSRIKGLANDAVRRMDQDARLWDKAVAQPDKI